MLIDIFIDIMIGFDLGCDRSKHDVNTRLDMVQRCRGLDKISTVTAHSQIQLHKAK